MLDRIKTHLVPEVVDWHKHLSMWLAAFVSLFTVPALQYGDIVLRIWHDLPPTWRIWSPLWGGPLIFVTLFFVRYWNQKLKAETPIG